MKQKIEWIALICAVTIFGIIVYALNIGVIHHFDDLIYLHISKIIEPGLTIFLKIITDYAGPLGIVAVTILLLIFMKNKQHKKYMLINLASVFALNQTLKLIFFRERPNINRIVEESGFSFPSGHSMVATGFYGFLIYLMYKNMKNEKLRNLAIIGLTTLILLIGISRIYLGVHYASDVIGGFAIALAYLIVFVMLVKEKL